MKRAAADQPKQQAQGKAVPIAWIRVTAVTNGYVIDVRRGPLRPTRCVARGADEVVEIVRDALKGGVDQPARQDSRLARPGDRHARRSAARL